MVDYEKHVETGIDGFHWVHMIIFMLVDAIVRVSAEGAASVNDQSLCICNLLMGASWNNNNNALSNWQESYPHLLVGQLFIRQFLILL